MMMLVFLMGISTISYLNSKFFVKIFDNYIPDEKEETDGSLPESQKTLIRSSLIPEKKLYENLERKALPLPGLYAPGTVSGKSL